MTARRVVLALLVWFSASFVAAPVASVGAATGDLVLISQNFNVPADGTFTPVVELPSSVTGADLSEARIAVNLYPKIDRRETLVGNIVGPLPRPTDTVEILRAAWVQPAPNQVQLDVRLVSGAADPDTLNVPAPGLYAVQIVVSAGNKTLTSLLTFVNRLPAATENSADLDPLSVAMAIGARSNVRVDNTATPSLDVSAVDEMTRLTDALEAVGTTMPVTVRVAPGVLENLQQTNPALFERLAVALQRQQVIADPLWPLDPSAAAAAGQQSLFTTWLRDGASSLSGLLRTPVSRATFFVDQPVSADGAALRRNLGADLMVMVPATYYDLEGAINEYNDYTGELVGAELSDVDSIDAVVIDSKIAALLDDASRSPAQTAVYAVAQLLATRLSVQALGGNPRRHAVVVGMPDLGVPDADVIGRVAALIAETPGLAPASLDNVGLNTDRYVSDGKEQRITLPSVDGAAVQRRVATQATISGEIDVIASMLPADDERPVRWRSRVALLPTTALSASEADVMTNDVRSQLGALRRAVGVPEVTTINLSGRRSIVRLRFTNDADVPLSIKVRLSSPPGKLTFTNDPAPIVLEPRSQREVQFPVVARSNGTSGVSLDVFAPNDAQLVDTVPLNFRVNAIGIGNVVTIALVTLVALWWLQHARSIRRKRRQAAPATLPGS